MRTHSHTHRALLEEGLISRQQENQGLRRRGRLTPVHLTCVCKLISKESENKPPSEERGAEVRSSSRVPRASPLCVLPSSPCCGACAGGRVRGPGGAGRGRLLSFAGPQGWPMPPGSRGWWTQRRHRSQGESIRPLRNGNGSTPTFPQGPPRGQGQTLSARARPAGPLPLKDQVAPRGGPEPRDRPASMPWAALPPPPWLAALGATFRV